MSHLRLVTGVELAPICLHERKAGVRWAGHACEGCEATLVTTDRLIVEEHRDHFMEALVWHPFHRACHATSVDAAIAVWVAQQHRRYSRA